MRIGVQVLVRVGVQALKRVGVQALTLLRHARAAFAAGEGPFAARMARMGRRLRLFTRKRGAALTGTVGCKG